MNYYRCPFREVSAGGSGVGRRAGKDPVKPSLRQGPTRLPLHRWCVHEGPRFASTRLRDPLYFRIHPGLRVAVAIRCRAAGKEGSSAEFVGEKCARGRSCDGRQESPPGLMATVSGFPVRMDRHPPERGASPCDLPLRGFPPASQNRACGGGPPPRSTALRADHGEKDASCGVFR